MATTWSPTATSPVANVAGRHAGRVVELEHGDVVGHRAAEHRRRALLAVDRDGDLVGVRDDVGVGEDVAVGVEDDAGAGTLGVAGERALAHLDARGDRDRRGLHGGDDAGDVDVADP